MSLYHDIQYVPWYAGGGEMVRVTHASWRGAIHVELWPDSRDGSCSVPGRLYDIYHAHALDAYLHLMELRLYSVHVPGRVLEALKQADTNMKRARANMGDRLQYRLSNGAGPSKVHRLTGDGWRDVACGLWFDPSDMFFKVVKADYCRRCWPDR